jgi:hypothetical protein
MFIDMSEVIHYAWEGLPMPKYQDSEFPGESESHDRPKNRAVLFTALAITGRKYFVSADGYIGLVPKAAQEGDMICIFMGGMTLFIIRPAGENYKLVGACYVHGLMHGEAVTEFEKNGQKVQDFILV